MLQFFQPTAFAIRINKPAPVRIVVSRPQVVQSTFLVVDVRPVPERVRLADRVCAGSRYAQQPAPGVIRVFYLLGKPARYDP